jgi:PAS domain S-box-containing protein
MGSAFPSRVHILKPQWVTPSDDPAEIALPLPAAWRCNLADDSLTWSAGVFELFGIARGSRVDRRAVVEHYCDESRDLLERLRSDAIANCGSFTFEARIRRLDGDWRWMRVSADVAVKNGRATHLFGMKQDITAEFDGR